MLGNTYHLMLRPGAETVAALGGLGRFAGWNGLTLTDSGGFQVFSLDPAVDDDGVTFKSTYDGSTHRFTPEIAVTTQELLGADIQMVLDVCPSLAVTSRGDPHGGRSHRGVGGHRTHSAPAATIRRCSASSRVGPARRCVQRAHSERSRWTSTATASAVSASARRVARWCPRLTAALAYLPADRPRYLMGVGDPASLVEAVALGVDQFDCVMQTRIGRHGTASDVGGQAAHQERQAHAQRRATRRRMLVRGLRAAQPGLHPPPVPGRRADGVATGQPAQHQLDAAADGKDAVGHRHRDFRLISATRCWLFGGDDVHRDLAVASIPRRLISGRSLLLPQNWIPHARPVDLAAEKSGGSALGLFVPMILIGAAMYFLMIRPQRRKMTCSDRAAVVDRRR